KHASWRLAEVVLLAHGSSLGSSTIRAALKLAVTRTACPIGSPAPLVFPVVPRLLRRFAPRPTLPSNTEGTSMRRVFRMPFSKARLARDVDDEILFHLQSRIDALVSAGMSVERARETALKQFGDPRGPRGEMLVLDEARET